MTGALNRLTAPEWLANHDRRLDALERKLGVSQSDLPRRRPAGGGPQVAYFNNSTGVVTANYQSFNQRQTVGDDTWFVFPSGGDKTIVKVTEPGIYVAIFHGTRPAGNADAILWGGAGGAIGHSGAASSLLTAAGSVALDSSVFGTPQEFRVQTTGGAPIYGQLAIAFWAGEPTFDSF